MFPSGWNYSPGRDAIRAVMEAKKPRSKSAPLARDAAKRALDIVGSSLLLTFFPVFLLVAALVKLTSEGPISFPSIADWSRRPTVHHDQRSGRCTWASMTLFTSNTRTVHRGRRCS